MRTGLMAGSMQDGDFLKGEERGPKEGTLITILEKCYPETETSLQTLDTHPCFVIGYQFLQHLPPQQPKPPLEQQGRRKEPALGRQAWEASFPPLQNSPKRGGFYN